MTKNLIYHFLARRSMSGVLMGELLLVPSVCPYMWAVATWLIGSGCRLGGDRRRGRSSLGWILCRNGVLIDDRLVCEKLTIFPYANFELCVKFPFLWCSQVQDRSGGWREIRVQKRNKTNSTWRSGGSSRAVARQSFLQRHSIQLAYAGLPSRAEPFHSARLVIAVVLSALSTQTWTARYRQSNIVYRVFQ